MNRNTKWTPKTRRHTLWAATQGLPTESWSLRWWRCPWSNHWCAPSLHNTIETSCKFLLYSSVHITYYVSYVAPNIPINPSHPPGSRVPIGLSKLCENTKELFTWSLTTRFPLSRSIASAEIDILLESTDQIAPSAVSSARTWNDEDQGLTMEKSAAGAQTRRGLQDDEFMYHMPNFESK
jgi:hypothetical protein